MNEERLQLVAGLWMDTLGNQVSTGKARTCEDTSNGSIMKM